MEQHLPFLRSLPLLREMTDEEILRLLGCLRARERRFEKNQIVWEPAARLPFLCVIVEGGLRISQEDWRGNRSIVGDFGPGDFLGEVAAADGALPFFLSVPAATTVILLESNAAMNPCARRCGAHLYLLRNMVDALARKEERLLDKIEYLSRRTTREKLMAYLAIQAAREGSRRVRVPYTRQELADLLSVDRSAMCTELTRMQNDGLLRCDRRHFELLDKK